MRRVPSFNKSLTILVVVLVVLSGGVVLLEAAYIAGDNIVRLYYLAERASLDYEKTVQETADYLYKQTDAIVGWELFGMYREEYRARELAIVLIEEAQGMKVSMGWVGSVLLIYEETKKARKTIVILCAITLITKDFRDAQAQEVK